MNRLSPSVQFFFFFAFLFSPRLLLAFSWMPTSHQHHQEAITFCHPKCAGRKQKERESENKVQRGEERFIYKFRIGTSGTATATADLSSFCSCLPFLLVQFGRFQARVHFHISLVPSNFRPEQRTFASNSQTQCVCDIDSFSDTSSFFSPPFACDALASSGHSMLSQVEWNYDCLLYSLPLSHSLASHSFKCSYIQVESVWYIGRRNGTFIASRHSFSSPLTLLLLIDLSYDRERERKRKKEMLAGEWINTRRKTFH